MNSNYYKKFTCVLLLFFSISAIAQVGINTTNPQGILDVNSSTHGVVLPRVSLTSTTTAAPVVNPQGGALAIGTVVYNTNTTTAGSNDVSPGMYVWDGSKWFIEFTRKQSELYEQSPLFMRTSSSAGYQNISGLQNINFTAKYTGNYKIKVDVNYAGGDAIVPIKTGPGGARSNGYLNVAKASGNFRFAFGTTNYDIPAYAFSTAYEPAVGGTNFFAIWQEYSIVLYVSLKAGDTRNFNLSFDQDPLSAFRDGGENRGRGHIAYDIPCTVEITYVGD